MTRPKRAEGLHGQQRGPGLLLVVAAPLPGSGIAVWEEDVVYVQQNARRQARQDLGQEPVHVGAGHEDMAGID